MQMLLDAQAVRNILLEIQSPESQVSTMLTHPFSPCIYFALAFQLDVFLVLDCQQLFGIG